jgi:hypothetical protein
MADRCLSQNLLWAMIYLGRVVRAHEYFIACQRPIVPSRARDFPSS